MYYMFLNKRLLYREWILSLFRCCEATKDKWWCSSIELLQCFLGEHRNFKTDNVMKSKRSLWMRELLLIHLLIWFIEISSWPLLLNWTHLCPCNSDSLFTEEKKKQQTSLCYWQPSQLKSNFITRPALKSGYLFQVKWGYFDYLLDRRLCKCEDVLWVHLLPLLKEWGGSRIFFN